MILSNEDVENYLKRGVIRITPQPTPEQIGPGSVDLTLSNEFWRFSGKAKGKIPILELEEIYTELKQRRTLCIDSFFFPSLFFPFRLEKAHPL